MLSSQHSPARGCGAGPWLRRMSSSPLLFPLGSRACCWRGAAGDGYAARSAEMGEVQKSAMWDGVWTGSVGVFSSMMRERD